jgi:hypothetical protein
MSVIDQLKKLDAQRNELLEKAKAEALANAETAIATLNELGFNYRLVDATSTRTTRSAPTGDKRPRRAGVRDAVFDEIKRHPDGITRQDLLENMHATSDKKQEQSVNNAVAALKKAGQISGEGGHYKAL